MAKLKMVAGQTYMCPPIFGPERVIVRGEVVEVTDAQADVLLADTLQDVANNTHNYFVAVEDGSEDTGEGENEPKTATRTRTKK